MCSCTRIQLHRLQRLVDRISATNVRTVTVTHTSMKGEASLSLWGESVIKYTTQLSKQSHSTADTIMRAC